MKIRYERCNELFSYNKLLLLFLKRARLRPKYKPIIGYRLDLDF